MLGFLIFYYCFSMLFMIGYVEFDELDGILLSIAAVICLLICAPIIFPFNLGDAVGRIYHKRH